MRLFVDSNEKPLSALMAKAAIYTSAPVHSVREAMVRHVSKSLAISDTLTMGMAEFGNPNGFICTGVNWANQPPTLYSYVRQCKTEVPEGLSKVDVVLFSTAIQKAPCTCGDDCPDVEGFFVYGVSNQEILELLITKSSKDEEFSANWYTESDLDNPNEQDKLDVLRVIRDLISL